MVRLINVEKHVSEEELEGLIRRERDKRFAERLIFIRSLYDGETVEKAAARLGRCKVTGYLWLKRWNRAGLNGLKPAFGGGRPPKISAEKQEELKQALLARDYWTTKEAKQLMREKFGVDYSHSSTKRILKGMGMRFAKPYPHDYRRPKDAEERLKMVVETGLDSLYSLEGENEVLVGFFDECGPQTTANTQRVWSFGKTSIIKDTTRYKANTFGFYAPGGASVVSFMENSKKESVCSFLEEIRECNPNESILMVLDRFSSHRAEQTRLKAKELGICLAYLPPYSPDLNPIEQIWRCLKRELSTALFRSEAEFLALIEKAYYSFSTRLSFAKDWIQKYLPQQFNQFCI